MAIHFTFSNNGRNQLGKSFNETTPFHIGFATSYLGNIGLMHNKPQPGCIYKPEDYVDEHGFWAYFIHPTAVCESQGSFLCLNTYDNAKFTFTFMQYAAHVANGDFVKYFRSLLQLPLAPEYFPELAVEKGQIVLKKLEGNSIPLENNQSTQALMDFLNPTLEAVDGPEMLNAARLIHWTINDPAHRHHQVRTAVAHIKGAMANYSKRYGLHGVPDAVCLLICDIRHQGRAKSNQIIEAMNTGGDYRKASFNLLDLGKEHYPERIKTLKRVMQQYVDAGILAKKKYDEASGDFMDL
jgi:hypothetical protein